MSELLSPAVLATAGLSVASLLVLLWGVHLDDFRLRAAGKTTASATFLAGGMLCGLHTHGPTGVALTVGLWLSFVGDVLLLSDQKRVFLAGLSVFLLGHVAYTAGFWLLGIEALGLGAGGVLLLPIAVVVWGWLKPHVERMRTAVLAYVAVISTMTMSAVASAWLDPTAARLTLLAAAVLFFLSDLFVARNRFIASEPRNRYAGLPLYYAAQWLFVLGGRGMKLWALSDLHLGYKQNREALEAVPAHPNDWLILGGDLGEKVEHLVFAFTTLHKRFAKLIWIPGNHELWSVEGAGNSLRGVAKYELLVSVCRELGMLTPENPWPTWPGEGPPTVICPMFIGFDYTMAPDGLTPQEARAWAREEGIVSRDESVLHPDPWPSREAWCADRLARTAARLDALPPSVSTVLINHWPLRRDLVRLYRIPRFIPWCGTRHTEDWHTRYRAQVVVYGHLHMRATDWRHGVRFEEVAAGYPRHWKRPWGEYLREILPGSVAAPISGFGGPHWHR